MADLASLFQVAPITAGTMVGEQQRSEMATADSERQRLAQLVNALQLQNQQSELMNPLLRQHQDLANQGLQAGLPGIAAKSSQEESLAKLKSGTLQSDIDVGNSNNAATMSKNQAQMLNDAGVSFGKLGATLENVPDEPGKRQLALRSYADQLGMTKTQAGQMFLQQLSSVPSAQLPQKLQQMGQNYLKMSEPYLQATDVANTQAASHIKGIGMQVQGQKDVEQMRIDAGKYRSKALEKNVDSALLAAKTPAAKAEVLEQAYYAAGPDDPNKAIYLQRATEARQRAAEDAANRGLATPHPDVEAATKGRVPNTPAPAATAPIGGTSPSIASPLTSGPQVAPPGAIAMLKKNPSLRTAFDAKYGPGASGKVLGQ